MGSETFSKLEMLVICRKIPFPLPEVELEIRFMSAKQNQINGPLLFTFIVYFVSSKCAVC